MKSKQLRLAVRVLLSSALLVSVAFLSGCASESVSRYKSPALASGSARKVAVLPLANLTTHPNAGQILGEMLFTELKGVPSFALIDNTESWSKLTAGDQEIEEAVIRQRARQTGKELGVDTVVYGSVTEYRYKRGLEEEPSVGVAVRLIDVSSGEILFATVVSRVGGCDFFCKDSLSRTAQTICSDLVRDIRAASAGRGATRS